MVICQSRTKLRNECSSLTLQPFGIVAQPMNKNESCSMSWIRSWLLSWNVNWVLSFGFGGKCHATLHRSNAVHIVDVWSWVMAKSSGAHDGRSGSGEEL